MLFYESANARVPPAVRKLVSPMRAELAKLYKEEVGSEFDGDENAIIGSFPVRGFDTADESSVTVLHVEHDLRDQGSDKETEDYRKFARLFNSMGEDYFKKKGWKKSGEWEYTKKVGQFSLSTELQGDHKSSVVLVKWA